MAPLFLFLFLSIVVTTLVTVAVGFSWMERRRKKQVEKMLATVSARPVEQPTVLLDPLKKEDILTQLLRRANLSDAITALLQQAGMEWTVHSFLIATLVFGVIGGLVGLLLAARGVPSFVMLLIPAVGALIPFGFARWKRSKRFGKFEEQFPEALDFLGRAMRAGHAFSVSFELICEEMPDPLGKEFRTFFNEQNLGAPLDVALGNLVKRVPLLDVRFFASAVILQRQTGGNLAEILNRLSAVIRERFQLKGRVRAASAHGKMTSIVLTLLPIGTMLGMIVLAPGYMQGMVADPTGRHLVIAAVVAMVLGFFIMKKITDIKV